MNQRHEEKDCEQAPNLDPCSEISPMKSQRLATPIGVQPRRLFPIVSKK